jgi:uncharacterized BrkB/YihY/UPF0761 family membrane protein
VKLDSFTVFLMLLSRFQNTPVPPFVILPALLVSNFLRIVLLTYIAFCLLYRREESSLQNGPIDLAMHM